MNKRSGEKELSRRYLFAGIFAYIVIITVCFYCLIVPSLPKYSIASTPAEELNTVDLSEDVLCLTSYNMEGYDGRLYTDADFKQGIPEAGDADAKYRTYRVVLKLEPGITYGLTGESAAYAQRVYINGELMNETGNVSDNAADFVPKTDRFTIYFTPETEETEIIIQHAWFNHQGGALHKLYLAEQPVITRINRSQTFCDGIFTGMLVSMALFFLGMFMVDLQNRAMLWFALSCLCAAVNYLIYESKQIMTLFPDLNWYAGHKAEALSNIYYFVFMILFSYFMVGCRPRKRITVSFFSLIGIVTVYYLVLPSAVYTKYTVPLGAAMLICELSASICLFVCEAKRHKLSEPVDMAVCITLALVFAENFVEGITYFRHVLYLRIYLQVLLAFLCAIVLMLEHIKVKRTLSEAQFREKQAEEEKAMLEHVNDMKSVVMRNLAHELKTPLTVMSGYAQLTEKQISKNMVNEETKENLTTIVREADRLSQMVTGLLNTADEGSKNSAVTCFEPQDILEDAAAVCRPVLMKRNNQLVIDIHTEKQIRTNREALLQVLINLSVNAGKHTRNGTVTYTVEDAEENMARFKVSDTGEGIREDILPHVFERGCTTDGGNGLGLPISREIIESYGGNIYIQKTGPEGTVICFTVPQGEEERI